MREKRRQSLWKRLGINLKPKLVEAYMVVLVPLLVTMNFRLIFLLHLKLLILSTLTVMSFNSHTSIYFCVTGSIKNYILACLGFVGK